MSCGKASASPMNFSRMTSISARKAVLTVAADSVFSCCAWASEDKAVASKQVTSATLRKRPRKTGKVKTVEIICLCSFRSVIAAYRIPCIVSDRSTGNVSVLSGLPVDVSVLRVIWQAKYARDGIRKQRPCRPGRSGLVEVETDGASVRRCPIIILLPLSLPLHRSIRI